MITVTLSFPNRQQREVLLAGIPRVGEHVRLGNGASESSLLVEQVVYLEARNGEAPQVLVIVKPYQPGPDV